jgi:hypothetical protein
MPTWKRNKSDMAEECRDLEWLPRGRHGWDCTLASLAFGMRIEIPGAVADLNAWASHHGVPPSARYAELGERALVLWHGTSRERADKIAEHGLFHKRGLWTARHPMISHSYCRSRSERFGTDGAVVCIVVDQSSLVECQDFTTEMNGSILRFHHPLPPEVVEYVLTHEEIRFTGVERAASPRPWPAVRFKHVSGNWVPVQRAPVRFLDAEQFSTLDEFLALCLARLARELGSFSAIEAFSVLYSLTRPWDCLEHGQIMDLLHSATWLTSHRGKWTIFEPNPEAEGTE